MTTIAADRESRHRCHRQHRWHGNVDADEHKARTILRKIIGGEIRVEPHAKGKHLVSQIGLDSKELAPGRRKH